LKTLSRLGYEKIVGGIELLSPQEFLALLYYEEDKRGFGDGGAPGAFKGYDDLLLRSEPFNTLRMGGEGG